MTQQILGLFVGDKRRDSLVLSRPSREFDFGALLQNNGAGHKLAPAPRLMIRIAWSIFLCGAVPRGTTSNIWCRQPGGALWLFAALNVHAFPCPPAFGKGQIAARGQPCMHETTMARLFSPPRLVAEETKQAILLLSACMSRVSPYRRHVQKHRSTERDHSLSIWGSRPVPMRYECPKNSVRVTAQWSLPL
jgi:hypothetical protein